MANNELKTWPERVYLQSENEHGDGTCAFGHSHEITWCQDQISKYDVEYVRADLVAAAPAQGALTDAPRLPPPWHTRTNDMSDAGCMAAMKAEIADLRAAVRGQVSDAAAYHADPVRAAQDIALAEAVRDAAALQYSGVDEPTEGEWSMVSNIRGMDVVEIILAVRADQAQVGDAPGGAA